MTLYQNLPEAEQKQMIAELVHLISTDETMYHVAKAMIASGRASGKFDRVNIGHEEYIYATKDDNDKV